MYGYECLADFMIDENLEDIADEFGEDDDEEYDDDY